MSAAQRTLGRVILTVEGWQPLSLNALERMHHMARGKYRSTWGHAVWAHWSNAGQPWFEHPSITIRCYYAVNRKRDADNAAAGVAKTVCDALKTWAFWDDDARCIDLQPVGLFVDRDHPRVEIELCEKGEA